jgi:outer membrane protein assembly factor BamB
MQRVRLDVLAIAIIVTSTVTAGVRAENWPQWRGPSGQGVSSDTQLPTEWEPGKNVLWKTELPGSGMSSPIVWADRIYVTAVLEGEAVPGQRAVKHKQGKEEDWIHPDSVAADRQHTFKMLALDAKSGKILWQKPAPAEGPTFTTSQSPMVDRGLLIVHVGGAKGGALTAFDPATGNPKWQWTGDGPSYGSPIVAELGGVRQVVTFTLDNLVGVSAETGEQLWIRPFKAPSQVNAGTPIVFRDMVIVSGQDAGITAFRVARQGGKWVTENVWENDALFYRLSNSVIVGNALFGLSPQNRGQFFFIDAATGKTLWTGEPRVADNAAVAKSGNLLLVLKTDGQLIVADGSNTSALTPIRTYKVAEPPTWGAPSFSGNRIFVKDATGVSMWTTE